MPRIVPKSEFRVSYNNLKTPRLNKSFPERPPAYSAQFIISKDDSAVTMLKKAINDAITEEWGDRPPKGLKLPLKDGDVEKEGIDTYRNAYYFNATNKDKPGLIDMNHAPIIEDGDFVSGDYCYISITVRAFNHPVNKGVTVYINNAMFSRKGEALGSQVRAEDDFAGIAKKNEPTYTREYDY